MPEQTAINDSQIRSTAAEVEILANLIAGKAEELRKAFDQLYPNIHFAHPVKDKAFDRFLLTLARVKMMADELPALAYQARLMREFHMPQRPWPRHNERDCHHAEEKDTGRDYGSPAGRLRGDNDHP